MDLAKSDPQNRWGALKVLWKPYARIFSHRGISHNPVFGPLTRIAYIGFIAAGVNGLLHLVGNFWSIEPIGVEQVWEVTRIVVHEEWLWYTAVGLVLPNELHILVDRLSRQSD